MPSFQVIQDQPRTPSFGEGFLQGLLQVLGPRLAEDPLDRQLKKAQIAHQSAYTKYLQDIADIRGQQADQKEEDRYSIDFYKKRGLSDEDAREAQRVAVGLDPRATATSTRYRRDQPEYWLELGYPDDDADQRAKDSADMMAGFKPRVSAADNKPFTMPEDERVKKAAIKLLPKETGLFAEWAFPAGRSKAAFSEYAASTSLSSQPPLRRQRIIDIWNDRMELLNNGEGFWSQKDQYEWVPAWADELAPPAKQGGNSAPEQKTGNEDAAGEISGPAKSKTSPAKKWINRYGMLNATGRYGSVGAGEDKPKNAPQKSLDNNSGAFHPAVRVRAEILNGKTWSFYENPMAWDPILRSRMTLVQYGEFQQILKNALEVRTPETHQALQDAVQYLLEAGYIQ